MSPAGYPIVLDVAGRSCLVVGGGPIAARKAASLLDAGATVTVIAPEIVPEIDALGIETHLRPYERGDLDGRMIAITATGDPLIDGAVYADGVAAGVLVNAADDPDHCTFTLPAIVRRGPVTVAVTSNGSSPALATWLRDRLAMAIPGEIEAVAAFVIEARSSLRGAGVRTEGLAWHALIDALAEAIEGGSEHPGAVRDAFVSAAPSRGRR